MTKLPHPLLGCMAEFNFLPSRTLHVSRYETYASPAMVHAVQSQPAWCAAWHRRWSASILRELSIEAVTQTRYPALMLGLLSPRALARLAGRVGVVLAGLPVRRAIAGARVRALREQLGEDLLTFARRHQHLVDAAAVSFESLESVSGTLISLQSLGYRTILTSVSQSPPGILKRIELKLPRDTQDGVCPIGTPQAWQLCSSILNDMEAAWCSFFPVHH